MCCEGKTDNGCLGCKLNRGCVGTQVESKLINLGPCVRLSFNIGVRHMVVLAIRDCRMVWVPPVARDVWYAIGWGFDIVDSG